MLNYLPVFTEILLDIPKLITCEFTVMTILSVTLFHLKKLSLPKVIIWNVKHNIISLASEA